MDNFIRFFLPDKVTGVVSMLLLGTLGVLISVGTNFRELFFL